jgi:peroxygenase
MDTLTGRLTPSSNIVTCIKDVPATCDRPLPADLNLYVKNPGLARAVEAPDREHPQGTLGAPTNRTVLQQHCMFWDRDGDLLIYPWDTWTGCRQALPLASPA